MAALIYRRALISDIEIDNRLINLMRCVCVNWSCRRIYSVVQGILAKLFGIKFQQANYFPIVLPQLNLFINLYTKSLEEHFSVGKFIYGDTGPQLILTIGIVIYSYEL